MFENIKFDDAGLVPAIIQSAATGRVLMVAWMNEESLSRTIQSKQTVFYSRSRKEFWHKGETSGNFQHVTKVEIDCDGDALLISVIEAGPACHNGTVSCFDTETIFDLESH